MSLHFSGKGGECLEICPRHCHAVTFQDCGSCCQACDVLVWHLHLGDCSYENKTDRLTRYKCLTVFPLAPCHRWLEENSQDELFGPSDIRCQPGHKVSDPPNIFLPSTLCLAETPRAAKWYQFVSSDNIWIPAQCPTAYSPQLAGCSFLQTTSIYYSPHA